MKKTVLFATFILASCSTPAPPPVDKYDLSSFGETATVFGARLVPSPCIVGVTSVQPSTFRTTSGGAIASTLISKGVDILFASVSKALSSAAESKESHFKDGLSLVTSLPGPNAGQMPSCLHFAVGNFSIANTNQTLLAADATKQRILQTLGMSSASKSKISNFDFRSAFSRSELWLIEPPKVFAEFNLKYTKVDDAYFVAVSPTIVLYDEVVGTSRLGEEAGQRDLLFTLKLESLKADGKSDAGPTLVMGFDSVNTGTVLVPGTAKSFETDWKFVNVSAQKVVRKFEIDFLEARDASPAIAALAELFAAVEEDLKTEVKTALDPALQDAEADAAAKAKADEEFNNAVNTGQLREKKTAADTAIAAAAADPTDKALAVEAWIKAADANKFAVDAKLQSPFTDDQIDNLRRAAETP